MDAQRPLRVLFAGYPSAGKTTVVCSLLCAKVGAISVDRATKAVVIYGAPDDDLAKDPRFVPRPTPAYSDDGAPVKITIIDTPGVADAAEGGNVAAAGFTKLVLDAVELADVVLWFTSAQTAFLTSDEVARFKQLVAKVRVEELRTGRLTQPAVVLTKYDHEDPEGADDAAVELLEGEVADEPGANSLGGRYKVAVQVAADVAAAFPGNTPIPVLKFSAWNRIRAGGSMMSAAVRKLASSMLGYRVAGAVNGRFFLGWALADLDAKRADAAFRSFHHRYIKTPILQPHCSHCCGTIRKDCERAWGRGNRYHNTSHCPSDCKKMPSPITDALVAALTADAAALVAAGGGRHIVDLLVTNSSPQVTAVAQCINVHLGPIVAEFIAALETAAGLHEIRKGPGSDGASDLNTARDPFVTQVRSTDLPTLETLALRAAYLAPEHPTTLAVGIMATITRGEPRVEDCHNVLAYWGLQLRENKDPYVYENLKRVATWYVMTAMLPTTRDDFYELYIRMWGDWHDAGFVLESIAEFIRSSQITPAILMPWHERLAPPRPK